MRISLPVMRRSIARLSAAVAVVVHDQHAERWRASFARGSSVCGCARPATARPPAGGRRTRSPGRPRRCRASTVPPCISTSRFTSVRPMPSPPCARRQGAVDLREHVEDVRQHRPAGMPMPVSRTRDDGVAALRARRSSQMRPPALGVLARRCSSRFETTWASRVGSASRWIGSAGSDDGEVVAAGSR